MSRSTNINLLPEEMITEIFTRLPSKSLGLCKCVSKAWDSFISDPCFVKTHLAKTSVTKLIVIGQGSLFSIHYGNNYKNNPNVDGFASRSNFKTSKYFRNIWSKVWGSCNGLVLLENNRGIRFLLNPSTNKFKRLPPQYGGPVNRMFGFGYDSSSDDYVVVCISCHPSVKGDAYVFVYKLKENRWKKVEFSPYDHTRRKPVPGIFLRGYLHWFAKDVNDPSLLIVAFNIANMEFSRVQLPNEEYGVVESWIRLPVALAGVSCLVSTHLAEDSLVITKGGQFVSLVSDAREITFQPMKVLGMPPKYLIGMTYVDSLVSPRQKDWKKKNT
ncbi:hypothetical protein POM88_036818 [Heracleum sosnowskyi]|uniref:F-box domain-containing protein n=1 Tax=Heracleum sosnowskyi TaxID=360622 RepID=A0AAD8MER5_9APIA|nr:hypothetical protein POM88_036818 [Heracleum sosnowskyi]